MRKEYRLFIDNKEPRKNSKDLSPSYIQDLCSHINENVNVGEEFVFRPIHFYNEDYNTGKAKSHQNIPMILKKRVVDIVDDMNFSVKSVIHIYIETKKEK